MIADIVAEVRIVLADLDSKYGADRPLQPGSVVDLLRRMLAEVERLREAAAPDLLAACKAAEAWVAISTAENPDRHPKSISNAKEDLAILQAAIAKAEPPTREE